MSRYQSVGWFTSRKRSLSVDRLARALRVIQPSTFRLGFNAVRIPTGVSLLAPNGISHIVDGWIHEQRRRTPAPHSMHSFLNLLTPLVVQGRRIENLLLKMFQCRINVLLEGLNQIEECIEFVSRLACGENVSLRPVKIED